MGVWRRILVDRRFRQRDTESQEFLRVEYSTTLHLYKYNLHGGLSRTKGVRTEEPYAHH